MYALNGEPHQFVDGQLERQADASGRFISPLAMRAQIGCHAMNRSRSVEDRGGEPYAVVHCADQRNVAVGPCAFKVRRVQFRLLVHQRPLATGATAIDEKLDEIVAGHRPGE
jgi:hypothetical protein